MSRSKLVEANEKIAKNVTEGFNNMSDGVVSGYKKIENAVVGGYTKIEDKFVERYLAHEGASRCTEEYSAGAFCALFN